MLGISQTIRHALALCVVATLAHATAPDITQSPAATALRADIPTQSLARALEAFALETGLQVFYESDVVAGRMTAGVPGGLSAAEALTLLLDGTGLQFTFLTPRSVRISPAAATVPQKAAASEKAASLDEVVVSATKRESTLARLPMSVSVFSPRTMETSEIRGLEGIALRTPGVEYDFSSQFGSGTLTNLAVRGINSNTGQSTTALYIDDAPIHAWHVDTAFGNPYPVLFDLARVEVLRGPQGTLFGTGAEGGAIRFITNAPSVSTVDAYCQAALATTEYGEPSYQVGAAAGGPLIDGELGARVSAWYQRDGGYVDRVDPFTLATVDANANHDATALLRLALAFAPDDHVRVLPSYTYQSLDIHDSPNFYLYLSDPGAGILRNGKLLEQPAADSFSLAALRVDVDLGRTVLTSATSYFDRTSSTTVDQTNQAGTDFFGGYGNRLGPAYPSPNTDPVANALRAHQLLFSQEIRWASAESQGRSNWVAGLYYGRSRVRSSKDTYLVSAPEPPGLYSLESNDDTDLAAFGDSTISLSRRWRVSLGARLERTRTDNAGTESGFANPVTVPFYRKAGDTGSSLAPRLAVSYEPTDEGLLYASASKGFRAGGLNIPECGAPAGYEPDSVWSYEAGAKDSFFAQRLRIASSLFYSRWSDIQHRTSTTAACFVDYTSNLGEAVSRGFDLSAEGLLGARTSVSLDLGYLDARYTSTITTAGNVIVQEGTAVGALPTVPSPWSLTARVEYRLPMRAGATAYAGAEDIVHSHNTGPFLESNPASPSFTTTEFSDPATNLLNLHVGWTRSGLDLRLSLTNALNAVPPLQRDSDASGSTLQYAHTFRPRTLTLAGTQRF